MHIGKEIRRKLEERHRTVVWFAEKLSYTRANIYKIFDKSSIDTEFLLRVSEVLDFDFFALYSEAVRNRNDVSVPEESDRQLRGEEHISASPHTATA